MKTKELLKEEIKTLMVEKQEALFQNAQIILNLVQGLTNKDFFVIHMSKFVTDYSIEFGFDRGEKKAFGLEFSIRWNNYLKTIELSHSIGLSAEIEYMKEIKPFIIERDKIIAKLWDYESLLESWFIGARAISKEYETKIEDKRRLIDEINMNERAEIANKLKVGTTLTNSLGGEIRIIKATPKRYYLSNGWKYDKGDLVCVIQQNKWKVGGQDEQ